MRLTLREYLDKWYELDRDYDKKWEITVWYVKTQACIRFIKIKRIKDCTINMLEMIIVSVGLRLVVVTLLRIMQYFNSYFYACVDIHSGG